MCSRIQKLILSMLVAVLMLSPISAYAADSGAGTMTDLKHTVIAPGFEYYARSYGKDDELQQKGFSLELAPNSEVYPIVMACDTIWGGMTMDVMVSYARQQGYNVVGAVNTAFFHSPGVPIGLVVEDGILKSSANGLHAFAIMEDGTYYTARNPKVDFLLENTAWGDEVCELDQMNKLFHSNRLCLYTSAYSTVSTRVDEEETVWVVRLRIDEGEMKLNGTVKLTVAEVLPEAQAVPIGDEYMILTASTEGPYAALWRRFAVGDSITVRTRCEDEQLAQAKYITGCGDILVEDGKIADSTDWMHQIAGQNPRTMVGWRSDGTLVMYVAEGRNPGVADGLTLKMAAEEMLRQGCVYAVNMDGGGSSIIGGRLPGWNTTGALNRPSDGGQRQCASYIVLVTDRKQDGTARYWHLNQNNLKVLPGQRVYLSVFGTDGGLYPADTQPEQVFYGYKQELLRGNLFVAPKNGGTHRVTMWGSGASGEGEIRVISQPSVLKIVDEYGRKPTAVELERGERLNLKVIASHNGEVIPADLTVIEYEMSVPLGKVSADGIFTADALVGTSGTLTMRIGDYTQQLQVTVINSRTDVSANRIKTAWEQFGKVS